MSKETEHLKLFKYDKETDDFNTTTFNVQQALNDNWDKIDAGLADITTQQAENMGQINTSIEEIEKKIANYNSYASSKDSNGIYKVVEYKKSDGKLYMKSTLSVPDDNGNYTKDTWLLYAANGSTVMFTIIWTITYDEDSNIVSKVVS